MVMKKVKEAIKKVGGKNKSDVPRDFPRILYHADGHSCLWTSGEIFDEHDDGKWAFNRVAAALLKDKE